MDCMFEAYLGHDSSIEPDDIPKTSDPVWILGKKFNAIQEIDLIRRDVQSRLWCTYRRAFVPIGTTQLTTDKGWGCMLRCGQMVLAQALIDLHLGRDWFWTPETRDPTYLKIVNRFEDSKKSPFSIHQIALMGDAEDKKVGEWFGPNTIAQVLKRLVKYDDWCSLSIHVALDNTIVVDDILDLCLNDDIWQPLLLIIPLRLGLTQINNVYINNIKKCFELSNIIGIIGGKPNQALYFIGYVGDQILYLDPHTTQKSGNIDSKLAQIEIDMDKTYHQKYVSRINFLSIDPSLALCFSCRTRIQFDELCSNLEVICSNAEQHLFEIIKIRPKEWIPQYRKKQDSDCNNENIKEEFVITETEEKQQLDGDSEDDYVIID